MKTKKIQLKYLKPGMNIKTYNPETNAIVYKHVDDVWQTTVTQNDQVQLVFDNGTIINCSINHPIMVERDNQVVEVKPLRLTTQDVVITENGKTKLVERNVDQTNDENYIDITVDEHHTFFTADDPEKEMVLTHNSQGGVRGGAATVNLLLWHLDVEDLLVLKNNKGTPDNRVRRLDYCYLINNFMYQRAIENSNITLFSPHEVPDLYEAFFSDSEKFTELYEQYENDDSVRKKTVAARQLFSDLVVERKETGRIYILNVDNVNSHSSFNVPVQMTNLCVEILLPTTPMKTTEEYTIYAPKKDLLKVINELGSSDLVKSFKILEVA